MDMQNINLELAKALMVWDPFGLGEEAYDPEIADTLGAVHDLDDPVELAKKIGEIYEFSFEREIPQNRCLDIAKTLLEIKNEGSCAL